MTINETLSRSIDRGVAFFDSNPSGPIRFRVERGNWNWVRPETSAAFNLSVSINDGAGHVPETFAIALKAVFASVRARGYATHTQGAPNPDGGNDIVVTIEALDC